MNRIIKEIGKLSSGETVKKRTKTVYKVTPYVEGL